ncbi:hypothetical protein Tco_0058316 [Tanacetum coccineum]
MSDLEHSTVSYTSISSDSDPSTWGISLMDAGEVPEMDPYKEVAQQGHLSPLSPTYAPDPMELEHRVPLYVPEPVKDLEEDPINYVVDVDDDENEEESSEDEGDEEEEHLDLADTTAVASPDIDLAPIPFPSKADVARLLTLPTPPPSLLTPLSTPLPQIPSPPLPLPLPPTHTSLTYAEAPLGYRADIPPRKKILLTALTPGFEAGESSTAAARQTRSIVAHRVDYSFVDTMDASIRASNRRTMTAIEIVNLRRDHFALRDEVDTLRRYLSSLCITHEQERVEARQDLDRSEAHNKALEARIAVLEDRAQVDTKEDTGSSS